MSAELLKLLMFSMLADLKHQATTTRQAVALLRADYDEPTDSEHKLTSAEANQLLELIEQSSDNLLNLLDDIQDAAEKTDTSDPTTNK